MPCCNGQICETFQDAPGYQLVAVCRTLFLQDLTWPDVRPKYNGKSYYFLHKPDPTKGETETYFYTLVDKTTFELNYSVPQVRNLFYTNQLMKMNFQPGEIEYIAHPIRRLGNIDSAYYTQHWLRPSPSINDDEAKKEADAKAKKEAKAKAKTKAKKEADDNKGGE